MRHKIFLLSSIATFVLAGCSTTSGGVQYKASTANVIAIQDYTAKDTKVKLADFTADPSVSGSMWCRANGPVAIGSGKSPAQFIHDALQEELFLAQVYSNNANTVLSGRLDDVKFSSVSPANWQISLTLSSSTGQSYQTVARHDFDTSWNAISACKNVADAFAPAVQETLRKAISDARFKKLMAGS